jgi:ATP-dependent helicase/nuclease subunit A
VSRVQHAAILASAGSGKTFQLAHRFIHLMLHGVSPARICALTFSRKAACEIFESIVEQLVGGCLSEERREGSARILGHPSLSADDFRGLLRGFVEGMHRARIGTLDSFMVGVVRAFPAELGAPAGFGLADGDDPEAVALRMDALSRLLAAGGDDAMGELLDMHAAVHEGRITRVACRSLMESVEWHRAAYLSFPESPCWRDPVRIWGRAPALPAPEPVKEAGDALIEHLAARADLPAAFASNIRGFVEQAAGYRPDSPWRRFISGGRTAGSEPNPLTRLLTAVWRSNGEPVECRYGRAKTAPVFAREEVRRFRVLLESLLEIQRVVAVRRTDGLYRLLDAYERHYQAAMRSGSMMTFDDVQRLLHPEASDHGLAISRAAGPHRLYIDYRLDGELDHWLIDEFQDTSDQQWAVIRNLVDEVLQDDGGTRSFFCVGDVKQAIYGWRGGNAALFGEVLETYGDRIRTRPMHECRRSCPAVLDAVNRVFGRLDPDLVPEPARNAWNAGWADHTAARDEPGYACLLETARSEPADDGGEGRSPWGFVADLVSAIQPRKRGWTVGVLTRRNEVAGAVGDAIRAECPGLEVAVAGSRRLADNPVVHTLLALIRFAAHPGHTQAWRQVQMSPLRAFLDRNGWGHAQPAR